MVWRDLGIVTFSIGSIILCEGDHWVDSIDVTAFFPKQFFRLGAMFGTAAHFLYLSADRVIRDLLRTRD